MKEYIVPFTDDADIEKVEMILGTNGELIRCKDCKYYTGKWCKRYAISDLDLNDVIKSADDYCSLAERKEDYDLSQRIK